MKILLRLHAGLISLFFISVFLFNGCAINDEKNGQIDGLKVWLDASEGTKNYSGSYNIMSWENLADSDNDFFASAQGISFTSYTMTSKAVTALYFPASGYAMKTPIVLDNATFSVVFAGNMADTSNDELIIPTRSCGDIRILHNGAAINITTMGQSAGMSSFTFSSGLFIFIFTESPTGLNIYGLNPSNGVTPMTINFVYYSGYSFSANLLIGNGYSYITDVMIFDRALSGEETNEITSYYRKKHNF